LISLHRTHLEYVDSLGEQKLRSVYRTFGSPLAVFVAGPAQLVGRKIEVTMQINLRNLFITLSAFTFATAAIAKPHTNLQAKADDSADISVPEGDFSGIMDLSVENKGKSPLKNKTLADVTVLKDKKIVAKLKSTIDRPARIFELSDITRDAETGKLSFTFVETVGTTKSKPVRIKDAGTWDRERAHFEFTNPESGAKVKLTLSNDNNKLRVEGSSLHNEGTKFESTNKWTGSLERTRTPYQTSGYQPSYAPSYNYYPH
jgi:hypothetical protein